jgi:thiosulfate/3-mercaptopyruvate sulfurtransferase
MSTLRKVITGTAIAGLLISTGALPAQAAPKNQARAVAQADWLEKNLDNPKVRIIEVSTEAGLYERGHIKNAIKFTWHTDLVDTVNRDIISAKNFSKFVQKAGISDDTTVVLYGDKNNWFAAWGAWIFNIYGQKDVRVLDGGLDAWNGPMGTIPRTPTPCSQSIGVMPYAGLVLVDEVVNNLNSQQYKIVDARSEDRFQGQNETLDPVGGHIPDAMNRFFKNNLNKTAFKTPEQLFKEFSECLGSIKASEVIHSCGSGVTACHNLLAMELAGFKGSRLYAGSWSEWCADPKRPVEL